MHGVTLFPVGEDTTTTTTPPPPLHCRKENEGKRGVEESRNQEKEEMRGIMFLTMEKRKSGSVDPADGLQQHK